MYQAKIQSADLSANQIDVQVTFFDAQGKQPDINRSYSPQGMSLDDFLLTVKQDLGTYNAVAPLLSSLKDLAIKQTVISEN